MQSFVPILLLALAAVATYAQSSPDSVTAPPAPDSPSMPTELPECSAAQVNEAQIILTSNQHQEQCETALHLSAGTMLQVATASANILCDTASCITALQELYNVLPNCHYNLRGLQHSAEELLEYCGITPTNTTDSKLSSNPAELSAASNSSSKDTPSTASNTPVANSPSPESSAAVSTITVSTVLAMTIGIAALT